MSATRLDEFVSSARAVHATVSRTSRGESEAAIGDAVEAPAVGTPLPFDGVTLPPGVEGNPTPADLEAARSGVTPAAFGIAEHGSVVVASTATGEEPVSLYPERHVAVVAASDLVPDVGAAVSELAALAERGRDAVVATGPSATADMGELVLGAHGPREVHVVILEDG